MPRGRPPAINPARSLNTHLDEAVMAKLDLFLWSELEGRIPRGAYKTFFEARIREFFETVPLDLSPFIGSLPGEAIVRGSDTAIWQLRRKLESDK